MYRRSLSAWLVLIAWLVAVGPAQAGNPFGWLGFGHQPQTPPAPRVIEVLPLTETAGAGSPTPCLTRGGYVSAPPAYPWGYFGARPGMGFVWHSGYYGDVSHWCQ